MTINNRAGTSGMFTRLATATATDKATADKSIQFVFANPGVVRGDNHQLKPGAWVNNWKGMGRDGLTNFRRNPVVIEGHNPSSRGVGKVTAIDELPDGRLVGTVQFADTEDGNELYEIYRFGAQSACSIGWATVDATRSTDPARGYGALDITRAELMELSLVAVPADEGALVVGRSAKRDSERSRIYAQAREAMTFRSLGEQLRAVVDYRASGVEDHRLQRAPLGAGEIDPSTGGFLVAPQFSDKIVGSIYEQAVIAPLVSKVTSNGPLANVKVPAVDETSRADGSRWGGATSYWAAEAAAVSASFPRWRNVEFSAKKLIAITYASSELYDDVALLEAHLTRALASELSFKLDAAIFNGSAGQPLGVLNSPALITVPKANAPCRRNAIWLVNEDIMLVDLSQYLLIGSDMKTAISADISFLSDQIVFRFTMRVDGAPLWASPITPFNGTSTRSPFVTLAAR